MKRFIFLAGLVFVVLLTVQSQPAVAQPAALRVVIKPLVPFIIKEGDAPTGFSIDLWREIAARNGWKYTFVWRDTVTELLETVEKSEADVGIAGISMTTEREEKIDFSLSMFNAGLQIMTAANSPSSLSAVVETIFSGDLLRVIGLIALAILVAGHVVWLSTRGTDPEMPKGYLRGLLHGIYVAGGTLASVGFVAEPPKRAVGRLAVVAWMFFAVVAVSYFTAAVTSSLTLQGIQGAINGPSDLPGKRIVSVDGSTASKWLTERGINHTKVERAEDAYPMLAGNSADALVYDAPVLLYEANKSNGDLMVVGPIFKHEQYGIAVPTGSSLRENINRTLLEIYNDGTYQLIYGKWFGAANAQ